MDDANINSDLIEKFHDISSKAYDKFTSFRQQVIFTLIIGFLTSLMLINMCHGIASVFLIILAVITFTSLMISLWALIVIEHTSTTEMIRRCRAGQEYVISNPPRINKFKKPEILNKIGGTDKEGENKEKLIKKYSNISNKFLQISIITLWLTVICGLGGYAFTKNNNPSDYKIPKVEQQYRYEHLPPRP